MDKLIIASIGHTAAGKTTLLKSISQFFNIPYISEGELKRNLIQNYSTNHSLDESLRDKGYELAYHKAITLIEQNNVNIIIDASFHKQFRRQFLYEAVNNILNINILWLYVYCPNEEKVRQRIDFRRTASKKTAEIQADRMYIYKHIINNFDEVNLKNFPIEHIPTQILFINTDNNRIEKSLGNFQQKGINFDKFTSFIESYLKSYT